MAIACAIDFGTSNSTLALVKDGEVRQVALDPFNRVPTLMPTLMYFQSGAQPVYGARAIQSYLEAELEGRLIQSVKRHLPSTTFDGTSVGRATLSLEHLIGGFLRHLRQVAEREAGEPVRQVLLGRPARFSPDPERDAIAEGRLRGAAEVAGFERIEFQVEPVAAARSFERSLDRDVLCFVGDLGGGTSDFTLIRLGPDRVRQADRLGDVLGVSGLDVAGNDIDARIVWTQVVPHFGVNAHYRPAGQWVDVPTVLHHAMTRWHTLCQAKTDKNLKFLDRIIAASDDRPGLTRLRELIEENYGYLLFQSVERAKIDLGERESTRLSFDRGNVQFDVPYERAAFEASTEGEVAKVRTMALALLDEVGVSREDVDVAFLTGGTSQLRRVRQMFAELFPGRLVEQDAFSSVGQGLGVEAAERFR